MFIAKVSAIQVLTSKHQKIAPCRADVRKAKYSQANTKIFSVLFFLNIKNLFKYKKHTETQCICVPTKRIFFNFVGIF